MLGGLYTNEQNKQTNKQNKQTYGRTDERADRQTDEHTTTPTITQKEKKKRSTDGTNQKTGHCARRATDGFSRGSQKRNMNDHKLVFVAIEKMKQHQLALSQCHFPIRLVPLLMTTH